MSNTKITLLFINIFLKNTNLSQKSTYMKLTLIIKNISLKAYKHKLGNCTTISLKYTNVTVTDTNIS